MNQKLCNGCGCPGKEVRPYGAMGAFICFDCAFSSPAAKHQTEQMFRQQLSSAGSIAVIDGSPNGPFPHSASSVMIH